MVAKRQARQDTKTTKASNRAKIKPKQLNKAVEAVPITLFESPTGTLKWIGYLLSFLPPLGFILGLIYFPQKNLSAKVFGRTCIILAGIGLLGLCFCWGMGFLMKGMDSSDMDFLRGYY